jgi:two-component system, OmpR family, phosphate regulon sensor histidine kinase PhoR
LATILVSDGVELSGKRGHHLTCQADANVQLSGVPDELSTAFSHLIGNAIQYTPEGGDIDVRWYLDARGACFDVADSGGTGFGLYIVKHVLERHNATLESESTLGQGSVSRCVFPY